MNKIIFSMLLFQLPSINFGQICPTEVCLTWKVKMNELILFCKVSPLRFHVKFFNPFNNTIADCLPPIPKKKCDAYYTNSTIDQNLKTNITMFMVRGKIDNRVNGNWTCTHGTGWGIAYVEVTVLTINEQFNCTTDTTIDNTGLSTEYQGISTMAAILVALSGLVSFIIGVGVTLLWKKKCSFAQERRNQKDETVPKKELSESTFPQAHNIENQEEGNVDIYPFSAQERRNQLIDETVPKKEFSESTFSLDHDKGNQEEVEIHLLEDHNNENQEEVDVVIHQFSDIVVIEETVPSIDYKEDAN